MINEVTQRVHYSSQVHESQFLWIRDIWRDLFGPRPGRRWVAVTLIDGDTHLRDGLPHTWLFNRLCGRTDVSWRHIRANQIDHRQQPLSPGDDLIILGRGKPIAGTYLGPFVTSLEGQAAGKFLNPRTGQSADTIRYGERRYTRRFLEEPAGTTPYPRCYRDYGVFMLRQHGSGSEQRTIVSIGGIGHLGTLIMMFLLYNDAFWRKLTQEIDKLVRWKVHHRPEKQFEICVRVEVDGEEGLSKLLDAMVQGKRDGFDYRLEVVAVGTEVGKAELFFRNDDEADLELRIESDGGSVRAASKTAGWVRMAPLRFAVLLALVEDPQRTTPADLCRRLKSMPADETQPNDRQRNNLSRVIHDLNADLISDALLGPQFKRPIGYNKASGRYLLNGFRATVLQTEAEASCTGETVERYEGAVMG
jgi:hypothetical protein